MKKQIFLFLIMLLLIFSSGCQNQDEVTINDPIEKVTHDGLTIEITDTEFEDNDLMVTFKITEEIPAEQSMYQLLMPWAVFLENGERIESSHSAFYNVFDENQGIVPGVSRLEVFFENLSPTVKSMDIQAKIKPLYLVPSDDGYGFEMDLDGIKTNGVPVTSSQLGFLVTATAMQPEADVLHITVRVEATKTLLESLSYSIQPVTTDHTGRTYTSNHSFRQSDQADYQEETLVFTDIDPQADSFSLRYPIQVRASLPDTVDFLFQNIPLEE
jgi:hypothetical protein